MLLPLIESCLPESTLRIWQRNSIFSQDNSSSSAKDRLDLLMKFIRAEVEGEQKVALAMDGFGIRPSNVKPAERTEKRSFKLQIKPTATALFTSSSNNKSNSNICGFCDGNHCTKDCGKASNFTVGERELLLKKRGYCFLCLKIGHISKYCKGYRSKCIACGKDHHVFVCHSLEKIQENRQLRGNPSERRDVPKKIEPRDSALANMSSPDVVLQTLKVILRKGSSERTVRALIDTGSQRSYILTETAEEVHYPVVREERVRHQLFGGSCTELQVHKVFRIYLSDMKRSYYCNFEVFGQHSICGNVTTIPPEVWTRDLRKCNIDLTDFDDGPIQVLIGADIAGKILTGRREILANGLVAIETLLGWTIMGKFNSCKPRDNVAMIVTNLLTVREEVIDLWSLDVLGITDPSENRSKTELQIQVVKHFNNTLSMNDEGRYEVRMPWLDNHPELPTNYCMTKKRLESVIRKLNITDKYDTYNNIFLEWEMEGIIERNYDLQTGHFLPHRPVYKEESTTKIRPVFDASAHEKGFPALNNCLDTGINLIEVIPEILNRFRTHKIGLSADIRKAFLQISLAPSDRDFLKFLWYDTNGEIIIYRHCRVVFGVCCSPFLLGATIQHHITSIIESNKRYSPWILETLLGSFYVDNCLTSVDGSVQAAQFISDATDIMNKGKFDLRGWEQTAKRMENSVNQVVNVLGLQWDPYEDTLCISTTSLEKLEFTKVTKRVILPAAHRIFDPIGLTCCVSLVPKLLIQETWKKKMGWEQEVDEEMEKRFIKWKESLDCLPAIKIPRWLIGTNDQSDKSLHIFCDASKLAYAAVAFLRVETSKTTRIQLVQGKSRVSPIGKSNKRTSIPRLELMAVTVGARLYDSILKKLKIPDLKVTFWTDSSTAIAWIGRDEMWEVFVRNRVVEIRSLTPGVEWKHVPGPLNPADLASRGCNAAALLESKWWEGPSWLKEKCDLWPVSREPAFNEAEINTEKKVNIVSATSCVWVEDKIYQYFSKYKQMVRMMGWMLRFCHNAKNPNRRIVGNLSVAEYQTAEVKLLQLSQRDFFTGITDYRLKNLRPFLDGEGLIRVQSKISYRNDSTNFCKPVVLPDKNHPVTRRLIMDMHRDHCHAGVQILLSILRENYWIVGGRRTVRSVIGQCVPCKRHSVKPLETLTPPLPEDRVRDSLIFEICGMDIAGPVYIRGDSKSVNKKAWICIFTCAVYRAVHLELLSSMSTDRFLQCFRRFIKRRGRPATVYTDNGSNFQGAANALNSLNWDKIAESCTMQKIKWKFIPPSAPWWGGWWERLIRVLKQLLRRTLGRTSLDFEEMQSMLCDCEDIINSRPLTYLYDTSTELTPLTPNMFLRDIKEAGVLDIDMVKNPHLEKRLKYRQQLRTELNRRFRNEYLGQLSYNSRKMSNGKVLTGDVVLVESDNMKRLDWPLAKVEEVIEGHDGEVRCVRLKTAKGILLRPIQRICPLEMSSEAVVRTVEEGQKTNNQKDDHQNNQDVEDNRHTLSGRRIRMPVRFR